MSAMAFRVPSGSLPIRSRTVYSCTPRFAGAAARAWPAINVPTPPSAASFITSRLVMSRIEDASQQVMVPREAKASPHVPPVSQPALRTRDSRRVHLVAAAELADGFRQVVAHGPFR